jgi:hypothetical protein
MDCNPILMTALMTGTFDGYLYIMRRIFTLMYVYVDVKLLLFISYSFGKPSAKISRFGEKG